MPARTGRGFPSRPTNWSVSPPVTAAAGSSFISWPQSSPIQRSLNPSDYTSTGTVTAVIEFHGFTSDATKPLEVRLKNVTTGNVMGGSGGNTAALTKTRFRGGSTALTAGANVYQVEYGGINGATHEPFDAVVILTVTP